MSISFWFRKDTEVLLWSCDGCGNIHDEEHPIECPRCGSEAWTQYTEAEHYVNFSTSNAMYVWREILGYEADYAGEIGSQELFRATSGVLLLEGLQDQHRRRVEAIHELAMAAVKAEDPLIHWG